MSALRQLARALARHAADSLPPARATWAAAMRNEVELIPGDGEAARWAVGAVFASYGERIAAMGLLQTGWAKWGLALLMVWLAWSELFAPAMIMAYRLGDLGLTQSLGRSTAGDDYHRFIPLMQATPWWLIGLGVLAALFYLAAACRLALSGRSALPLFLLGLVFTLAEAGGARLLRDSVDAYRQAVSGAHDFATHSVRRDILIPAALFALPLAVAALLWLRERAPRELI